MRPQVRLLPLQLITASRGYQMSAATEALLEDIKHTTEELDAAMSAGDHVAVTRLNALLKELKTRFNKANEFLVENRSILKG